MIWEHIEIIKAAVCSILLHGAPGMSPGAPFEEAATLFQELGGQTRTHSLFGHTP